MLIITLLFSSFASAQTVGELAELARRERARRGSQQTGAEVYTTEGLAARFQRATPELIGALENLGDAANQFSSDFAQIGSDAAGVGGDLSGSMTEMLEVFEAEALREVSRLRTALANPLAGNRPALQAELVDAEQVLAEVRAEMVTSRGQTADFQAAGERIEEMRAGRGDAPSEPEAAADAGREEAWIAWQAELDAQQDLIQTLEDREVRQQLDINRFRAQVQAPIASQAQRDAAQQGITDTEAALVRTRTDLEAARVQLEQIQLREPAGG